MDVTCYGIEIETYIGRDRAAEQWEVGTATIVLDNDTGWADFPPTITPNPFDLTVRPGRQVRVAVIGRRRRAAGVVAGLGRPGQPRLRRRVRRHRHPRVHRRQG